MKENKKKIKNILFWFKSIQTTILFSFFLLIITSLCVFFLISLRYTEESVMKNSTSYVEQLINLVNGNMDSYITYMEDISEMVTKNGDVKSYLFVEQQTKETEKVLQSRIVKQFQTILSTRKDICNIGIINDAGMYIINRGNSKLNPYTTISEQTWYQEAKNQKENFALSISHIQNIIMNKYDWVITLSRSVINTKTGEQEGIFFIDMNYNFISSLCEKVSLGEKGYIYILDEKGNIIYHPQQQLIYSGLKTEVIEGVLNKNSKDSSFIEYIEKDKKVYTVSKSEKTGWTIVGVSYMSELLKERNKTQMIYILVTMLLLGMAVIMAALLSEAITRPIKKLDSSMKEVEKGNFKSAEIEKLDENEIGRLSKTFNVMTREIEQLMQQNVQEQTEKRRAEIRALQAQIHPHFLYNTLDSIIWMAESGKNNDKVVIMTAALAKLLRKSIGNNDELVTIAEEIDYIKTYLTIQSIRYRDQMEYEIEVEEEILKQRIVKITLQPLVENAIYHGIKYIEQTGKLKIIGYKKGQNIILKVIDNGKGMSQEELKHIFKKREKNIKTNQVAVYNIQNRLQLYYSREYGLSYESEEGVGTTVTVCIPIMKEEYDEI